MPSNTPLTDAHEWWDSGQPGAPEPVGMIVTADFARRLEESHQALIVALDLVLAFHEPDSVLDQAAYPGLRAEALDAENHARTVLAAARELEKP